MSAVWEIEVAIEKLTKLRNEGAAGTWRGRYYEGTSLPKQRIISVVTSAEDDEYGFERVVTLGDYFTKANADLIVALHRTIDAQLAFLDAELILARRGHTPSVNHLALARAINGPTS